MENSLKLTVKQEQILSLAARGLKDQLIAETLGISVRTVQNHLTRIYTKTQTRNRVGAVLFYVNTKNSGPDNVTNSVKNVENFGKIRNFTHCKPVEMRV